MSSFSGPGCCFLQSHHALRVALALCQPPPCLGWDLCGSLKSQLKATSSRKSSLIAAAEMDPLLWTRWRHACPESQIHFILLYVRLGG